MRLKEVRLESEKFAALIENPIGSIWPEGYGWKGMIYSKNLNRYFFLDIPQPNHMAAIRALHDMEGAISLE